MLFCRQCNNYTGHIFVPFTQDGRMSACCATCKSRNYTVIPYNDGTVQVVDDKTKEVHL